MEKSQCVYAYEFIAFLNARSFTVESDDEKIKDKLITKNYTVSDSYIYILTVTW